MSKWQSEFIAAQLSLQSKQLNSASIPLSKPGRSMVHSVQGLQFILQTTLTAENAFLMLQILPFEPCIAGCMGIATKIPNFPGS